MSSAKYLRLKQHVQHDFPDLKWTEGPGTINNGGTDTAHDSDGNLVSISIHISYIDPNHLPFISALHEVGHFLSAKAGHHTMQLALRHHQFQQMDGIGIHIPFLDVLEEEERAWQLGQRYASKYGLQMTQTDLLEKNKSLNSYRQAMGLPLLEMA